VSEQRGEAAPPANCLPSVDIPSEARLRRADVQLDRATLHRQPPNGHARAARMPGLAGRSAQHFDREL